MQLKMDPSSDQLASAVSGATQTLVMSGSAPESPTTITIVNPSGGNGETVPNSGGVPATVASTVPAGTTNQATANGTSPPNRTNGSLKPVTPTAAPATQSTSQ